MKELAAIVEGLSMSGGNAVLATLVSVQGSSYRRPGARMLILGDGKTIGSVSGGCLEKDICENAFDWTDSGPCIKYFDVRSGSETVFGWGSGCKGVVGILLERAGPSLDCLRLVHSKTRQRSTCAVATIFSTRNAFDENFGARLTTCNLESHGDLRSPLREAVIEDSLSALRAGQSRRVEYRSGNNRAQAFIEVFNPPISLLVFGAGSDAVPVVRQASHLGWNVIVLDKNAVSDNQPRFPSGTRIIEAQPGEIPDSLIDEQTATVVMTHNYLEDQAIVTALLHSPACYVGLLGGRTRSRQLCEEVVRSSPAAKLEKLYAPVGMDIGALDPDEIAISIISEVLAILRGRNGGFLSEGSSTIHHEPETIVRTLDSGDETIEVDEPVKGNVVYAK